MKLGWSVSLILLNSAISRDKIAVSPEGSIGCFTQTGPGLPRPWMALVVIGDIRAPSCGRIYSCSHIWSLEQALSPKEASQETCGCAVPGYLRGKPVACQSLYRCIGCGVQSHGITSPILGGDHWEVGTCSLSNPERVV